MMRGAQIAARWCGTINVMVLFEVDEYRSGKNHTDPAITSTLATRTMSMMMMTPWHKDHTANSF